jgi:hypothetical protein
VTGDRNIMLFNSDSRSFRAFGGGSGSVFTEGQNSILSRVKTMLIFSKLREKKQQFEAIRGVHGIYQRDVHTVCSNEALAAT